MRFLALLLLAGCAALDPAADRIIATDRIIAEAVQTSRAPAAEQKAALTRAQQSFSASPSPLNRVRVGALLATLPPPLRDDAKATEMLEPVADASSAGPGRLAAMLLSQINERQRLARDRQQSDREREKREETMRQQLEALRSIERGILEREEKLRSRQR
jgi:hypothetical protein